MKDEYYGEEIVAWIIPDREINDTNLMVEELLKIADGKLAGYKLPKYIYITD